MVEKLFFKNSPYWTCTFDDVFELEVRYTTVDARIDNADYHDLTDMTAFNTDGFDVAGKNVWIHHWYRYLYIFLPSRNTVPNVRHNIFLTFDVLVFNHVH